MPDGSAARQLYDWYCSALNRSGGRDSTRTELQLVSVKVKDKRLPTAYLFHPFIVAPLLHDFSGEPYQFHDHHCDGKDDNFADQSFATGERKSST